MSEENLSKLVGVNADSVGPLSLINPYAERVDKVVHPEGVWRDIRIDQDGRIIQFDDWKHNLVVTSFATLLALLTLANGSGGLGATYAGVQYLALGTGNSSWDTSGVPSPSLSDVALVTEPSSGNFRKIVTAQNVDGSNNVSATPTNRVLCSATFNLGEANGALREWGLFGGNASTTAGSGYMIDHVTHSVINKPSGGSDFTLVRQVTLIF